MRKVKMGMGLFVMLLLCTCAALGEDAPGSWLTSVLGGVKLPAMSLKSATPDEAKRNDGYVGLLYVEGEIAESGFGYDHIGTLNAVDDMMADEDNCALALYLNTPGGSLFEADELYHKLMTYKQETGRPIYAYMAQECCSAGVYIAMAADAITASRMTLTGSVGVYMTTYSQAGLFDKLGIQSEYIATGENKVAGYPTLTDAQREIYQALVDESFGYFKDAIAMGRGLTPEQMEPMLDGRVLTAAQAKALGLIDEIGYYEDFTDGIKAVHGEETPIRDMSPEEDYGFGMGGTQLLDWLLNLSGESAEKGRSLPQGGGLKS